MRDSSSRTGYNVRYGLGRKEARIEVGELGGIVDPCVAVSKELRMSTTSHIMLQISKLGNLNLSFGMLGDIVGVGVLTEDVGVSSALFVGNLPLVVCWLLPSLAPLLTNELFSIVEALVSRFGLDLAPNISLVLI